MERIQASLLKGNFLHCRPVDGGPIIKALIIPSDEKETPTFRVAIVCPARQPQSTCRLKLESGNQDDRCYYYKGDSRGDYQIIGPGMDRKSEDN